MGQPTNEPSPHLTHSSYPVTLSYHKWWHSELNLPLMKSVNLGSLNGADEYLLPTEHGLRYVCKVECQPRRRPKEDGAKDIRWCDVVTGRLYALDDPLIIGVPRITNKRVKTVAIRMAEAQSRAMVPNFVITEQEG